MTAPARPGDAALPRAALGLFAALYGLQGVVVAYFFNFNKNYMRSRGLDDSLVAGVETLVLLPFVFKFLAGPLSDRVNLLGFGHRRPYILVGLAVQTLGLIGLATVDPGDHLGAFGALAFATVVGLALYDTCCDGMVVDRTPPGDRPRVQGILLLSRFLTTTVATLGFGAWLGRPGVGQAGVPAVLWACAALGTIPLAWLGRVAEPERSGEGDTVSWSALKVLGRPWTLLLLVYGAWYAIVGVGAEINLSAYYDGLGFGPGTIGVLGSARYAGRAAGALLLPFVAGRLGRRGQLTAGLLSLILATAGQAAVVGPASAGALAVAFGLANGLNDALFCVLAMEASDPRMAASTFALIMAVSNLSVAGDYAFAKAEAAAGGFRRAYVLAAAALLPLFPLTIPLGRPGPSVSRPEDRDASGR